MIPCDITSCRENYKYPQLLNVVERVVHLGSSLECKRLRNLFGAGLRVESRLSLVATRQPDLAPSDFHLFGPLKQQLGGKHLADDGDVQHEVLLWMRQQPKEFYAAGIGALIKRWDKYINIGRDYVEK
ncbi:hypothetical protein AVEN_77473-1 [Araneus ventricosus]|uniref:Histone-lysine N-methyltransferase SETMAR n=1 Tax=Araneus ventricosus TaxID=182803 RepID=A0A4Y2GWG7_ARAVE|nr:hypothetical protein AVEN_77473-1 [Araneus ventricosus]